jgi:hypothetical protein
MTSRLCVVCFYLVAYDGVLVDDIVVGQVVNVEVLFEVFDFLVQLDDVFKIWFRHGVFLLGSTRQHRRIRARGGARPRPWRT